MGIMDRGTIEDYGIGWGYRYRGRRLNPVLQSRIETIITRLAGSLPITVECLLHNGIQGVNGRVFPITTNSGTKIVVIEDEFVLLFRLADLLPHLLQMEHHS